MSRIRNEGAGPIVSDSSTRPSFIPQTALAALGLLVLALILYFGFVFGPKTLLYKDMGADSPNVYYPNYVLRSDYLREHGLFSWAFEAGMGQNISPSTGHLLLSPVIWLPKQAIAKGLIYQHLFYTVIGGIFFFRFLSFRGLTAESCFLGASLLSFSAYMCMGSCWYIHAMEIAAFAFLLYCADRAVVRGNWPLLAVGVALVALRELFHLYLTAIFLCLIVPAFVFVQRTPPARSIRAVLLLGCAAVLGVALTCVITITGVWGALNSPRGLGPASLSHTLIGSGIFHLGSPTYYVTTILRFFSNDLAGTADNFRGWQNYLEAPMSYCGLISLLFLPQTFIGTSRRQRIMAGFFLLFLILPIALPWLRYLFWAFKGDYFRTLSLFGALGMITLSMGALSRYSRASEFSLPLLVGTAVVLGAILFLPTKPLQALINPNLRWWIVALIASYTALAMAGTLFRRQRFFAQIIGVLSIVELLSFGSLTIYRPTVTKSELDQRVGYNDYTVEAVRDIKTADPGSFRISKTYSSSPASLESLNDAMIFGFYGTSTYSSFSNLNYVNFLLALNTLSSRELIRQTQWTLGLLGHPALLTFAGEKYVLTDQPEAFEPLHDYEFLRQYDRIHVFRNRAPLPMGLTFAQALPDYLFQQLTPAEKEEALFHVVILTGDQITHLGLKQLDLDALREQANVESDIIEKRRATGLKIDHFDETKITGTVRLNEASVFILQTPFDPGWHAYQDGRSTATFRADIGLLGFRIEPGEHSIELRYRPPFVYAGAVISAIAAFILAGGWWRYRRTG